MRRLLALVVAAGAGGCTDSTLAIEGAPITCDMLGGAVDGALIDPVGASTSFGVVEVGLVGPDLVTFYDGTLLLILGIGVPPRMATLVFPNNVVYATDGKLVIDESTGCHAGRFETTFMYHGVLSGWFAVAPDAPD